jgi:hypothetical protein
MREFRPTKSGFPLLRRSDVTLGYVHMTAFTGFPILLIPLFETTKGLVQHCYQEAP